MVTQTGRLLIVDDEDSLRTTLSANLEVEGYEVTEAHNGFEAVRLIRAQPFDLVITDVRMEGMDGLETFREIRKIRPGTVVMMMTGFASESLMVNALAEGAYTVLYKPFSMNHFMAIVARAVSRPLVLVLNGVSQPCISVEALRSVGLRAQSVGSKDQALDLVSQQRVDVCVLDLSIAGADAPSIFEQIQRIDPTVSVIAINGRESPSIMQQLLRQGSYACLRQPLDTRELVHAIARARRDFGRAENR